jgi:hypothetical protein
LVGSTTNNVLAGLPAYKSIYTYADHNTIFKDMEIGVIKGDKVYILTYEAGANEYDKYMSIVQELINSFQNETLLQETGIKNEDMNMETNLDTVVFYDLLAKFEILETALFVS